MATKRHKELRTIRLLRILSPLWLRILYQYLPKSSQPAKFFLTTDGHGLTRMKSGFLLSVSIRVHPWLDHLGCGFAALRCIDERNGISKIPAGRAGLGGADGAALRARAAVLTVPLRCDILSP